MTKGCDLPHSGLQGENFEWPYKRIETLTGCVYETGLFFSQPPITMLSCCPHSDPAMRDVEDTQNQIVHHANPDQFQSGEPSVVHL